MRWPGLPGQRRAAHGELGALVVCLGLLGASKMVLVICTGIRPWSFAVSRSLSAMQSRAGSRPARLHALPCHLPALTAEGLEELLDRHASRETEVVSRAGHTAPIRTIHHLLVPFDELL